MHTSNPGNCGSLVNTIHPPNILLHTSKLCSAGAQQVKRVLVMQTIQRLPPRQAAKQTHTVAQPRDPARARILLLPIDRLKYTLYKCSGQCSTTSSLHGHDLLGKCTPSYRTPTGQMQRTCLVKVDASVLKQTLALTSAGHASTNGDAASA